MEKVKLKYITCPNKKMLSIIIICYNKFNFTKSCLNDLFQLPTETHEIIVIDNASSDNTQTELLKINRNNFRYIRNETNLFHSAAANQGYRASTGEYVLFLNNDIKIKSNHHNWTELLLKRCDEGIMGCNMGQLDNALNFKCEAANELSGNSYVAGWLIASSRKNWNKLDLENGQIWNEKFPFYFNDTDLSFRARKLGIKLGLVNLPITHFGKISASQMNIPKLYQEGRKVFLETWKELIK
jgi:GT2 family glycosyltransferase